MRQKVEWGQAMSASLLERSFGRIVDVRPVVCRTRSTNRIIKGVGEAVGLRPLRVGKPTLNNSLKTGLGATQCASGVWRSDTGSGTTRPNLLISKWSPFVFQVGRKRR